MGKERDGRERNNDGDVLAQPGNGIATKNKLKQVCDNVTGRGVVGKERDRKGENVPGRHSSPWVRILFYKEADTIELADYPGMWDINESRWGP